MTRFLTRILPLVALTIGLLCAATPPAHAAAPAQTTPALSPSPLHLSPIRMDDEEDQWIEAYLKFLRRFYQLLGGNPDNLGPNPCSPAQVNAAMATVSSYWGSLMSPPSLTSGEITELHGDIGSMKTMLLSKPADISPGSFNATLTSIDAAYGY